MYHQIVDLIVTGEIAPGDAIRENKTAERLGTSRLPVREALQQLAAEGWLERRPRGIARLREPRAQDIEEVFDMRRLLEVEAIGLAVRRASVEDVARLRRIAEAGDAAAAEGDRAEAMRLNAEFHRELSALARHETLNSFLQILERKVHWLFSNVRMDRFTEHDTILDALEARDVEAARNAVREHIDLTYQLLQEKWSSNSHTN
ncbi:GntR family transcriptional regulator [Rhodococcus rhodochrous]|uniref:GntR family transcriptional regulator n=1 Tax=Rhodococcus rhodochrous TaxID=1829 RepID=UPI00160037EC